MALSFLELELELVVFTGEVEAALSIPGGSGKFSTKSTNASPCSSRRDSRNGMNAPLISRVVSSLPAI